MVSWLVTVALQTRLWKYFNTLILWIIVSAHLELFAGVISWYLTLQLSDEGRQVIAGVQVQLWCWTDNRSTLLITHTQHLQQPTLSCNVITIQLHTWSTRLPICCLLANFLARLGWKNGILGIVGGAFIFKGRMSFLLLRQQHFSTEWLHRHGGTIISFIWTLIIQQRSHTILRIILVTWWEEIFNMETVTERGRESKKNTRLMLLLLLLFVKLG